MADQIKKLYKTVLQHQNESRKRSKTARLFDDGRIKIAKKLVEEATEVSLECVDNNRTEVIHESVDMIYNWVVLLAEMGIKPDEVWEEMARRKELLGIAGKLPKRMALAAE